jgi:hypothetical protein
MNLTAHFTLEELIASDYAIRHGIANVPDAEIYENLQTLAQGLERIRACVGKPIHVSSGYRSPKLNSAIRGSKNSQHLQGLAADIVVPGISAMGLAGIIVQCEDRIVFDQVIQEGTWVHVSFPAVDKQPRGQVLTAKWPGPTYVTGLV